MKKILVYIFALGFLVSCGNKNENGNGSDNVDPDLIKNTISANDPDAENPEPIITFDNPVWDFGTINEGAEVMHTFKFTNTGNEELVISNCSASCGCTTPVCEKRPIAPGETGKIKVRFDSKNKKNNINKQVTIVANTNPPTTILTLKGYVTPLGEF